MKSTIAFYLLIFFGGQCFAQEWKPLHVSHWTYLYKNPDLNSDKSGVLATEASLKLLDSTKNFYKIKVENEDVGFIAKQKLTKAMRGKKDADEPSEYFYRGTQGSQCPHVFVQVSGLRVRSEPNTTSNIVRILPINKLLCIEYVPLTKNGWVYIGDFFHKKPEFVQYQYLGKEISFEETLQNFENTNVQDTEKRKIILERLVEIGWNSRPQNTLKALQLFKSFHQDNGTLASVPNLNFELFLAENIQNPLSPKERAEFNYKDTRIIINNTELIDFAITETQLKNSDLERLEDYSTLPHFSECGWDPEFSYVNRSKSVIINFENYNGKTNGTLEKLDLQNGNALILDQFRIDEDTTEEEFIKKFGKILDFNRFDAPGDYYLPVGDAGFMIITFKNRKAVRYQLSFYC